VNHLKRHLNVANVLSAMALFMALGGVTYAATAAKNSVKAKSIAKQAVTTAKLRNGAVTSPKIRNGAVISSKIGAGAVGGHQIADGSVRAVELGGGVVTTAKLQNGAVTDAKLATNAVTTSKINAEAVTTGKIGNEAVTGAKLSASILGQLLRNASLATKQSPVSSDATRTIDADCPPGKHAVGGGARVDGEVAEVALTESFPKLSGADRVGWTASAREINDDAGEWSVFAYAICAEP
jgi:hypothetical protein